MLPVAAFKGREIPFNAHFNGKPLICLWNKGNQENMSGLLNKLMTRNINNRSPLNIFKFLVANLGSYELNFKAIGC